MLFQGTSTLCFILILDLLPFLTVLSAIKKHYYYKITSWSAIINSCRFSAALVSTSAYTSRHFNYSLGAPGSRWSAKGFPRASFTVTGGSEIATTGSSLSTEYRRQSFEGYPTKVDWSAEIRVIENKKATETHEFDRFRPSVWRNTLLLWSIGLY